MAGVPDRVLGAIGGEVAADAPRCCARMAYDLDQSCEVHPEREECPDALIAFVRGGFGLYVHDGSGTVIEIAHCPWCGTALPPIGDLGG